MGTKTKFLYLPAFSAKNLFLFLLIVLAHVGFKTVYLNNSGLGYGEAFKLFYSGQDWGLIKHTAEWNRNAPLYYYFLNIWGNLFGISEVSIRLSSVIFSSMAAGLLFVLISKHFNKVAAFIALILFTFSNDIYFYSQEASSHSIVLFLAIGSFYLFFDLIETSQFSNRKKKIITVVLLGICNFLMVYAQYITVWVPAMQILVALIFFNKQIFKSAGISFLLTLLLSLWRITPKTLHCVLFPEKADQLIAPTFDQLKLIFYEIFNGEMFFWIFSGIMLLTTLYLLFTKRLIYQQRSSNIKFVSLLVFAIGGMFVCYFLYFLMPEFSKSYFLFVAPFFYAVIGIMVSKLSDEIKYAIAGATIFFSLCTFTKMDLNVRKSMDYRNVVEVVKKLHKRGTLILVETRDIGFLFAYYFDKSSFTDFNNMESKLNEKGVYLVTSAEDVKAIDLSKYNRMVLTQSFENINKDNPKLLEYLFSKYKFRVATRRYNEVGLTLFAKK